MYQLNRKIVTSVGYSFAFAALCSLAISPQVALADDEPTSDEASSSAASSSTGKRVYSAPVPKEKDETVYVFANPDGSVKNTEVSTTLKNPTGDKELADSSELTDIENAESDATFSGSGDSMVWAAAGDDVYYTGNTNKQAPVSVKVTYFLDGKKVSYDKLAGATGKLKIRYDYDNTATTKATIRGEEETLYVPFTFVTALLFDNENFKNAKVTNGKLINDGDRAIVAGYAIPGLQKSLGSLVKDFDIPDYFEVTADVTDFEMKTSLTIATAGLLEDLNADDFKTGDLENASSELTDAMGQILSGTDELKSGLQKLANGAQSAKKASGQLADGADTLAKGSSTLADGLPDAVKGAEQLESGAGSLGEGAGTLGEGLTKLKSGMENAVSGTDQLLAGADTVSGGIAQVIGDGSEENPGLTALQGAAQQISGGLQQTKSELTDMKSSLEQAGSAASQISGATSKITTGADNINAAANGSTDYINGALNALDLINVESIADKDEKDAAEKAIAEAKGALENAKGLNSEVSNGTGESGLKGAASTIDGGAKQIAEGAKSGISSLEAATKEGGSVDQLIAGADAIDLGTGQAIGGLQKISSGVETDLKGGLQQLKSGQEEAVAGLGDAETKDTLLYGANALQEGAGQLEDGASQLKGDKKKGTGLYGAAAGADKLAEGSDTLAEKLHEYDNGLGALVTGTDAAAAGTGELKNGLQQFNDEGISGISDLIDEDILPFKDRLDAISKAAKDYNNFAGITEGTTGTVKFIIETDPISIEE